MRRKSTENEINLNVDLDSKNEPRKISNEKLGEGSAAHQLIEMNMQKKMEKKLIRSKSFGDPVDPKDFVSIQKRIKSIMSLDDLSGDGMMNQTSKSVQTGFW